MRVAVVVVAFVVNLSEGFTIYRRYGNASEGESHVKGNATFKLYTRKNILDGVMLLPGDKRKLLASGFKGSLPTVLVTHGYRDDATTIWMQEMKEGILSLEDANFIAVDWSDCAKNLIYNEVVECMREEGVHTGRFLQFLEEAGGLEMERAHLIGHSLGAHLMGFAAKVFPEERKIGRITGLDPAGPLFEFAPESERLSNTSAKLVDVIHTCRVFLGMAKPIGTIDFYPNGGFNQIGCSNTDLRCHHAMCGNYFVKTISRKGYVGKRCNTLKDAITSRCHGEEAQMGYHIQFRVPGIYHVRIN